MRIYSPRVLVKAGRAWSRELARLINAVPPQESPISEKLDRHDCRIDPRPRFQSVSGAAAPKQENGRHNTDDEKENEKPGQTSPHHPASHHSAHHRRVKEPGAQKENAIPPMAASASSSGFEPF